MIRYDVRTGVRKIKTKTALAISALGLGGAGVLGSLMIFGSAHAAGPTIYNNIPNPFPTNLSSEGPEAYAYKEIGGQVQFDGTARTNPTVTVAMSSWACQSGNWSTHNCVTSTNDTFSWPITLNVYNVGPSNSVGSLVTTVTKTFAMPYRPTSNCPTDDTAWLNPSDGQCYHGLAFPISFDLTGTTLPDKAIISVAYNSTHYGYSPVGESAACYSSSGGCFYDSLNLGLSSPPSTGSNPVADSIYQNSSIGSEYCDNGAGGTNTLRLDSGCWTGYQPAISVTASANAVKIQIFKYVDGVQATAANANNTTFPMVTTFSSPNLGNYTNTPFTLSPSPWGGIGIPYEADFVGSVGGADYTASEVTTGNTVVGANCSAGNPYALQGYSYGNTLADAQSATKTLTAPQFTNIQHDYVMIVWNVSCPPAPSLPTNKDQCMNNGWKNYGSTFKNQGDCVSFVATQGKNQPSGPAKH